MAAKRGLKQRLQDAVRKRQGNPRPQALPTGNVRSDRWHEITENHPDILQAIETSLLETWRDVSGVDDHWVHLGLVAAMRDDPPDHPCAGKVFSGLKIVRERRDEVDEELWRDALRVVDQSVRDHSSLKQGERAYLSFVLAFIREALDSDPNYQIIEARVRPPEQPESS